MQVKAVIFAPIDFANSMAAAVALLERPEPSVGSRTLVQHLVRHGKRISEQELGRSGRTARRFAADLAAAGKTKEAFAGYVIWWSPSRQVVGFGHPSDILRISADSIVASPTRASATATTLSWNLYHFVPYSGIARVNLGFFHDPPLDPNYLMT